MKIIIVGTAYPLRGGIAHSTALLVSHLAKRHSVETITFKRQYPKFLFPGKTQDEQSELQDVAPAPQLIDSINPLNWIRVASYIRKRKPDVLIFRYWLPFFGPCFGTIAKLAKRKTDTKIIFICDNIIPHERRPGDVAFTKYAFKFADSFIVLSGAVEKSLNKYFPDAVYRKVPHPVYENFGTAISKAEARKALGITSKNVMLYFGYVRRYKGLMNLIEAMPLIRGMESTIGETMLLSVGEFYEDESGYRSRVRELGVEDRVRFVPEYIPHDRVALYFSAADVVVLPYLSATQSGIAQIAYNFDKPIITTNVGGLAEVVVEGKTGYVVTPDDVNALAAGIERFYKEHDEARFVAGVSEEKKKYSWQNLVLQIEELAGVQKEKHC